MKSNKEKIIDEINFHLNEPVIDFPHVSRLVGFGETKDDYYYILHSVHGAVTRISAVGGPIYLRSLKKQNVVRSIGGELWSSFTRLDSWLELNGAPKVDKMILESYL